MTRGFLTPSIPFASALSSSGSLAIPGTLHPSHLHLLWAPVHPWPCPEMWISMESCKQCHSMAALPNSHKGSQSPTPLPLGFSLPGLQVRLLQALPRVLLLPRSPCRALFARSWRWFMLPDGKGQSTITQHNVWPTSTPSNLLPDAWETQRLWLKLSFSVIAGPHVACALCIPDTSAPQGSGMVPPLLLQQGLRMCECHLLAS